jgi:hypothetical protein
MLPFGSISYSKWENKWIDVSGCREYSHAPLVEIKGAAAVPTAAICGSTYFFIRASFIDFWKLSGSVPVLRRKYVRQLLVSQRVLLLRLSA